MKAAEALEATHLARQAKALREREKELERTNRILEEANSLLSDRIDLVDKEIKEAIAEGRTSIISSTGGGEMYEVLAKLLVDHYREDGYHANWKVKSVDMGDSAAPCLTEQVQLTLSWEGK